VIAKVVVWTGDCKSGGHQICSLDKSKIGFYGSYDSNIKMIPSCIKRLVNLKWIDLSGTAVSKIEGLENNVKLERLGLGGTDVKKIEGLENNVKLEKLGLYNTRVSKIDCDEFEKARPHVLLFC
jgi:Leucine-rich repeat (LRR) protein